MTDTRAPRPHRPQGRDRMARGRRLMAVLLWCGLSGVAQAQQGPAQPVDPGELEAAIGRLGSFDYPDRMNAGRLIRRAPSADAAAALLEAVEAHEDGYVRFRALVLLSGMPGARVTAAMTDALADPNDRLRQVGYGYFEYAPAPELIPALLDALELEESEFVRPALVRALVALDNDPRVRAALLREVDRGMDFFRSAVIEALGDYGAQYAVGALIRIAGQDGPLQDDAALALGRIGDEQALGTLARLQRSAPRASQPTIAAAICLVGVKCESHRRYLRQSLAYAVDNPGHQDLARAAASGLAAMATRGDAEALQILLELGIPSRDPSRAPIALGVGTVAIRETQLVLAALEGSVDLQGALLLLRDAFDMLDEDLEEERFFVSTRRTYWAAAEGSRTRDVTEGLIEVLEF